MDVFNGRNTTLGRFIEERGLIYFVDAPSNAGCSPRNPLSGAARTHGASDENLS